MYSWYSVEYPKFLVEKCIYIVYSMYMYKKIGNNTTKLTSQSSFGSWAQIASYPSPPGPFVAAQTTSPSPQLDRCSPSPFPWPLPEPHRSPTHRRRTLAAAGSRQRQGHRWPGWRLRHLAVSLSTWHWLGASAARKWQGRRPALRGAMEAGRPPVPGATAPALARRHTGGRWRSRRICANALALALGCSVG